MSTSKTSVAIFPVLLVNFIGMLGYSIVIPILVFLVKDFGGNEFIYGLLGSIYPFFQLIGAPLLGRWSDEIGRKRVLFISQVGTFIAWVLFIVAFYLPETLLAKVDSTLTGTFLITIPLVCLFVARALDGITGGNVSVANAYLSDISTDANRKGNFGKMSSSTSLGFILGPTLASILGATVYGELLPIIAAAFISLVAIFVIQKYLPESNQMAVSSKLKGFKLGKLFQIEHKECYKMKDCPETGWKAILKQPQIPLLFLIYFLTFLGFSFFYSGFPVYASGYLEWSASQLGLFLAISSGIMVLVQGPVLSYLSDKVQDAYLVIIGSLLICANFALLPIGSIAAIYGANILMSVGNGLMWPSYLSILSRTGTPEKQGAIQGYANSMGSLASIFGLILGGTLFGLVGPRIFWIGAVMLFIIFILSFRLIENTSRDVQLQT
ncbi:MAG: MFS transporter [Thermonemataceae bacterium]